MSKKYGVAGAQTADRLISYGLQPQFIAQGNDTSREAQRFAWEVRTDTVLFPQSNKSLKTFEKFLSTNQVIPVITYQTEEIPVEITELPDIIVFTSPSNVSGYKKLNKELPYCIIAYGKKTARAIATHFHAKSLIPWEHSELAIADIIIANC